MAFFWTAISVISSLVLTPVLMLILCIIFLASIGKSLGVRKLYIKVLLMIFEVSKLRQMSFVIEIMCVNV